MQMFYKALVVDNGGITEKRKEARHDRCVKVRVLGIHPFEGELDFENVPDESLPWAKIAPSISGSNSKEKFNVPENGQWVWVFFEDEGFQKPVYFAFVTAETDVNSNFVPNKNTITTDRYNGQETVVTNEYQSNITNGNGLLLSTNDNKALLTNNKVAFLLKRENLQAYVGCDKDQSRQSMVYGNQLLDCLQSTLNTLNISFENFRDDYNAKGNNENTPIDVYNSIGEAIPNAIKVVPESLKEELQKTVNYYNNKIKEQREKLQTEINTEKSKPVQERDDELIEEKTNELKNLTDIPSPTFQDPIDLTEIKEGILKGLANSGMDKTVALGTQWVGEPFYTARISLAFLQLYRIIDNLYNRILYLESAEDVKKRDSKDMWGNTESKEGNLDRYKGINEVSNNLRYTLNNNSVFHPQSDDMNQLIIDEIGKGVTTKQLAEINNYKIVKSIKLYPENIRYIIVHCSASTYGDAASINKLHVEQNGWTKIGYHFVILNGYRTYDDFKDKNRNLLFDGMIESGRIITNEYVEKGAHEPKYNSQSIGICLIGGQTDNYNGTGDLIEDFTRNQQIALIAKIKELMRKYNIPKENVLGHCEVTNKLCPNFGNSETFNPSKKGNGMNVLRAML